MSFSHNLTFGLFYCRFWPPTTGRSHIMKNKWLKCVLFVVSRALEPLSMSSNAFVNGARMSGVCALITSVKLKPFLKFVYAPKPVLLTHRRF